MWLKLMLGGNTFEVDWAVYIAMTKGGQVYSIWPQRFSSATKLMKTDTEVDENRHGRNAIQLTYLTDYTITIH